MFDRAGFDALEVGSVLSFGVIFEALTSQKVVWSVVEKVTILVGKDKVPALILAGEYFGADIGQHVLSPQDGTFKIEKRRAK